MCRAHAAETRLSQLRQAAGIFAVGEKPVPRRRAFASFEEAIAPKLPFRFFTDQLGGIAIRRKANGPLVRTEGSPRSRPHLSINWAYFEATLCEQALELPSLGAAQHPVLPRPIMGEGRCPRSRSDRCATDRAYEMAVLYPRILRKFGKRRNAGPCAPAGSTSTAPWSVAAAGLPMMRRPSSTHMDSGRSVLSSASE